MLQGGAAELHEMGDAGASYAAGDVVSFPRPRAGQLCRRGDRTSDDWLRFDFDLRWRVNR